MGPRRGQPLPMGSHDPRRGLLLGLPLVVIGVGLVVPIAQWFRTREVMQVCSPPPPRRWTARVRTST